MEEEEPDHQSMAKNPGHGMWWSRATDRIVGVLEEEYRRYHRSSAAPAEFWASRREANYLFRVAMMVVPARLRTHKTEGKAFCCVAVASN